jgi:hypothetical protein
MYADVLRVQHPDKKTLPKGKWHATRKYDGMRGYYPGVGRFIYPQGRGKPAKSCYEIPDDWELGTDAFDCEMVNRVEGPFKVVSRGHAKVAVNGRKSKPAIKAFKHVDLYIFDLPQSEKKYEDRWKQLEQLKKEWPPYMKLVHDFGVMRDRKHLDNTLKDVVAADGEGIMVKKMDAKYEFYERTETKSKEKTIVAMKYKDRIDIEAKVVSNNEGEGIRCKDGGGVVFACNNNKLGKFTKNHWVEEKHRGKRVAVGEMVEVRHQGVILKKDGSYRYDNAEIVAYTERTWKWTQENFVSPVERGESY